MWPRFGTAPPTLPSTAVSLSTQGFLVVGGSLATAVPSCGSMPRLSVAGKPGSSAAHSVHGASNFAEFFHNLQVDVSSPPKDEPALPTGFHPSQTIYFVRHCEGEHNVASVAGDQASYLIRDPRLTAWGEEQAAGMLQNPAFTGIPPGECHMPELIVASPLRRTMETAMLGFGSLPSSASFVLRPELMENGNTPCDTPCPDLGSEMLAQNGWRQLCDEYAALPEDWHIKGSQWRKSVLTRFATLLSWLQTRPERTIAVVAHHGFFRSTLGENFAEGEVRAYQLEGGSLRDLSSRPGESQGAMRMKMGLKLSGFYRSPSTSRNGSRNGSTNGSMTNLSRFFKQRGASTAVSPKEATEFGISPSTLAQHLVLIDKRATHEKGLQGRDGGKRGSSAAHSVHGASNFGHLVGGHGHVR